MGLLWLFPGVGEFRAGPGSLKWTSNLRDTLTNAVSVALVVSVGGAVGSSLARLLWRGRKTERVAVLLELISVAIWFQLLGRFDADGPFALAIGLMGSVPFSLFGGGVGLWIGAPLVWRQPEREQQFWSMFCLMTGGLVGMSLWTCLAHLTTRPG
jgi:hypothetical protein